MPKLDLYVLPRLAPREALADATVIVVDLLRASTTIATALAAGAECVMPFAEIDETLAAAERFGRDQVLLGGERGGRLIPGFDLGNSPAEYTPERVAGRRILFTTTNGARALYHARGARRVLVGAMINRTAVAMVMESYGRNRDAVILCAGTGGVPAREDLLAGGAIIAMIKGLFPKKNPWILTDESAAALQSWKEVWHAAPDGLSKSDRFAAELRNTDGGRNLIAINQEADLFACARHDALTVVPELDAQSNELRPWRPRPA
jgi:2-phosphosulfolactate phosphatase